LTCDLIYDVEEQKGDKADMHTPCLIDYLPVTAKTAAGFFV